MGQAGAGDHDDKSNAKARPKHGPASESFGSVMVTGTDSGRRTAAEASDRPRRSWRERLTRSLTVWFRRASNTVSVPRKKAAGVTPTARERSVT